MSARFIDTPAALRALTAQLVTAPVIGLDVETTLRYHTLCLIQIATPDGVSLIDALALDDLGPLAPVFGEGGPVKVIHNASFERRILKARGLILGRVFDTLKASRAVREGPHNLAVVCERELGVTLDKAQQCSDWRRRPLSPGQRTYAALDASVLLDLYAVFAPLAPSALA